MKVVYNTLLKRSSTFALGIFAAAFIFERSLELGSEAIFRAVNRGKLWEDIKQKYEN